MNKIKILLICIIIPCLTWGQKLTDPNSKKVADTPQLVEPCGTTRLMNDLYKKDSLLKKAADELELKIQKEVKKIKADRVSGPLYTIPCVVHIVHTGQLQGATDASLSNSIPNPTDAQIRAAFDAVNADYNKRSNKTRYAGNDSSAIKFCLATKDELGNSYPTGAITRHDGSLSSTWTAVGRPSSNATTYSSNGLKSSSSGIADSELPYLSLWNTSKYFNIYIVTEIDGNNGGSGGQGFAYYPGSTADRAMMIANAFKATNVQTFDHEMGHALKLAHTFAVNGISGNTEDTNGGTCSNSPNPETSCSTQGDYCCDIPPSKSMLGVACKSDATANPCLAGTTYAQFQYNYMNYVSCPNGFSPDQVTRMRATISTDTKRKNQVTSANLAACGCDGNTPPYAEFSVPNTSPCVNLPAQFTDESLYSPTSWSWSFTPSTITYTGGTSASSQNPQVIFNAAGVYTVAMTATNAFGSNTNTKTNYITVVVPQSLPYTQDFEGVTFPPTGWTITNPVDLIDVLWARSTLASGNGIGLASAVLENTENPGPTSTNSLISPAFNFSGASFPQLTFKVAYQRYYTNPNDSLILYYSTDCGQTFTRTTYEKGYSNLFTKGSGGGYSTFVPGSTEWRTETIDLSFLANQTSVVLKFERGSPSNGPSNNLFLDDININETPPIANFSASPTSGSCVPFTVNFTDLSSYANSRKWYFGDGDSSTLQNPSHNYLLAGSYTVRLVATNSSGSDDSIKTNFITISNAPISVNFSGTPQFNCNAPMLVNFTDLSTPAASSWKWYFGDGDSSTLQNPSHNYLTTGNYSVRLIATNCNGSYETTKTSYISILTPPISSCTVNTNDLTTATTIGIYNVTFNTINNTTSDAVSDGGYKDFICTNYTTVNAGSSYPVSIKVGSANPEDLKIYIDFNNNGNLSDAGEMVFSFANKKNTNSGTIAIPNNAVLNTLLRMRVIDDYTGYPTNPCTNVEWGQAEDYGVFITCSTPVTPSVSIGATATSICSGSNVIFTPSPTNGGPSPSYQWKKNGVNITTGSSFSSTTLVNNDTIICVMTSNAPCASPSNATSNFIVITVKPVSNYSQNQTICSGQNVVVGIHTYSSSGTYKDTLVAANGCDSIVTTSLTVNSSGITFTQNPVICTGQSVTVGTHTYSSSGTYKDTLTSSGGCDSIITTNLTVNSSNITFIQNPVICTGQSIIVGINSYSTNGTFIDTLVSSGGCDSIVTTNLTVLPNSSFNQNISICNGQNYSVGIHTYNSNGTYKDTLTSFNGCDSIVTTNLTVLPNSSFLQNISICTGQSYTIGSNTYTSNGVYADTIVSSNGCDSAVITNLTVLSNSSFNQNISICNGQNYSIGIHSYSSAGTYLDTISSFNGCDSIVTTNLSVLQNVNFSQNFSVCTGQSITVGSNTYSSTGIYQDTLASFIGCDSIITTDLLVASTLTNSQSFTLCIGQYLTVGSNTYSVSGTFLDTFLAIGGCDSIITTNLSVVSFMSYTLDTSICNGQSVTVGTNTYSTSGTFTDTLVSFGGCDSIVTTNLTVLPINTFSQDISICNNQNYSIGTHTYNSNGTYEDTLAAFNGCDSIVTTNLNIIPDKTFSQDISICSGQSILVGTSTYNSNGTFQDTITASTGCDSIITTILTVMTSPTFSQNIYICSGQSYSIGSNVYNSPGIYLDTLVASNTCDSIVTTDLTVLSSSSLIQSKLICPGQTVTVGSNTYNSPGVYNDTLVAFNGCDSVVTTNILLLSVISSSQNISICNGQSYSIGSNTYSSAGIYIDTLVSTYGCDSIVTTNLIILSNSSFSQDIFICNGQSLTVGTHTYNSNGTFIDTFSAFNTCDSIVTTNLTILSGSSYSQNISICNGQVYSIGTNSYSSTGTFIDTILSSNGCDSIVTTNLTLLSNSSFTQNKSICNGQVLTVGSNNHFANGTYIDTLSAFNGCDSIVTTNLTVLPTISYSQNISICNGQTYSIGTHAYTANGTYYDTLVAFNGCDSIVITNLAVNTSGTPSISISVSPDSSICSGLSVTFSSTINNGGVSPIYQWKVNGVNTGITGSSFTTSSLSNNDMVSCMLISSLSCANPDTVVSNNITVSVSNSFVPSVSISASSNPACTGNNVTFIATAINTGGTPTYQWKINGLNVGANSPTFTAAILFNNDMVTCVMTSSLTCASPAIVTSNSITMTIASSFTPSVNITTTTNPTCSGSNVTFTALAVNGGSSPIFQWKKNGINVGINSANYTTNSLANNDLISCMMTSSLSCANPTSATSNIIIMSISTGNAVTPAVSITSSANIICTGSNVNFTAYPYNGGSSPVYQWKINGLNTGINSSTFSYSTFNNNDLISCQMTSNAVCATPSIVVSNNILITVNSYPSTPDTLEYCATQVKKVKLSSLVSPTGGTWSFTPDVNIIPIDTLNISNTPWTNLTGIIHTMTYTKNGCSKAIALKVYGADAGPDIAYCIKRGPFTLPSGTPSGGTWSSVGSGGIIDASTGYINPSGLTGNVKYIYTQSNCSDTMTVEYIDIKFSATKTEVSCNAGNDGSIILNVTGGSRGYYYYWSNGNVTKDIYNLTAGTYSVTVVDGNSCSGSGTFTITESPAMILSVNSTDDKGTGNGTATVSSSGGIPNYTYQWNTIPVQTTATAINLHSGVYKATVTDSKGCKDSIFVVVNLSTGIPDNEVADKFSVYPNPFYNEIYFDIDLAEKGNVLLFIQNLEGKNIYQNELFNVKKQKYIVNLSDEQPGIYFLKIQTSKKVWISKIILVK